MAIDSGAAQLVTGAARRPDPADAPLLRLERSPNPAGAGALVDWRGFHTELQSAAVAATQTGAPLSLLMLEPVSAKGIGEPCASQAAAELTGRLAGSVKAAIGSRGCLARYAEGRLAAILIDTDLDGAIARAERIARRLRARGAGSELSPAIGIAQFRDEESLGHLIQRAAAALERARSSRGVVADRGPARSGPSRLRDDRSSALPA